MEATDLYGLVPEDRIEHLRFTLARHGLDEPHVEVHPAAPGRYQLHDETLHRDAAAARRGAVLGMLVGGLLGWAVAMAVPSLTATSAILAATAAAAGFGALVGAMSGLQVVEAYDDDPVAFRVVDGDDRLAMVEVHDEHLHNRAHRILERHGAVFLQGPTPV